MYINIQFLLLLLFVSYSTQNIDKYDALIIGDHIDSNWPRLSVCHSFFVLLLLFALGIKINKCSCLSPKTI